MLHDRHALSGIKRVSEKQNAYLAAFYATNSGIIFVLNCGFWRQGVVADRILMV